MLMKTSSYTFLLPVCIMFRFLFLQALLANMAAMYAVYHGPAGLKSIAQRVHGLAGIFSLGLKKLGVAEVQELPFFDTVKVKCSDAHAIADAASKSEINLRVVDSNTVSLLCFGLQRFLLV